MNKVLDLNGLKDKLPMMGFTKEVREKFVDRLLEDSIFNKKYQYEIFILAATIGYYNKIGIKLEGKTDKQIRNTAFKIDDMAIMAAIAINHSSDLLTLKNPREIARIVEEYANGGIAELYKIVFESQNLGDTYLIFHEVYYNLLSGEDPPIE
jgi:hypothetical protein